MSGQIPAIPKDWESEINALLDGALDEASAEALKTAAARDPVLAQAIVEAWQLQKTLDQLQLQKAPVSLRRKLRRIPLEQGAARRHRVLGLPRWALAGGLASVALVAVAMMMMSGPAGQGPTNTAPTAASDNAGDAARVMETRRELLIAFHYLDKVGLRVEQEIHQVLNEELSAPVTENLSEHMPYSGQSHKEKHV